MRRILIIDDDRSLCEMLSEFLEKRGFHAEFACSGQAGLRKVKESPPDLVILDVMIPDLDGFEILKEIRSTYEVPILMFSGRDESVDRVLGLELGSDDYVVKPSSPQEILARINAILRRSQQEMMDAEVMLGPLRIDRKVRKVWLAEKRVRLTGTEFDLLNYLSKKPGEVVRKEALSKEILGRPLLPNDRSLDVHISHIRSKFASVGNAGIGIESVRGKGYALTIGADE